MKILKYIGGLLGLVVVAGLLAVFQPWSDFKPLDQLSAHNPARIGQVFREYDKHFASRKLQASLAPRAFGGQGKPLPDDLPVMAGDGSVALADHAAAAGIFAIMVVKDGQVIGERFFAASDHTTRFTSFSVAKSFTSTLVGMALHRGLIGSLDDRADMYVPEWKGTAYDGVTIEQLLQMSSGMAIDGLNEELQPGENDTNNVIGGAFLLAKRYSDNIFEFGRAREPGTIFNYNNLDTQALGLVLERVSGKPLYVLMQDWLWQPLGMEDDASMTVHYDVSDAEAAAFMGINATTRDFAKLGRFMLEDGVLPSGERLLPEGWVKLATRPQADYLRKGAPNLEWHGYGYQWWVMDETLGRYAAQGAYGQYIFVSEADNLVIAVNSADARPWEGRDQADLLGSLTAWVQSHTGSQVNTAAVVSSAGK